MRYIDDLYSKVFRGESKIIKKSYVHFGTITEKHYIDEQLVYEFQRPYPEELVLISDYMPDDTRIQIEKWDNKYAIGAYPVAKEDGWNNFSNIIYPRKGHTFRCHYDFGTFEEAKDYFDKLKKNQINLKALEDRISNHNISKERLALIIGY